MTIEHRVQLGTDGATFQLFHPADRPPRGWLSQDFMIRKDFAAGRLVSFGTGSDGRFTFRITAGDLTEREKRLLACRMEFRFVVRYGSVLLDNACDYDSFSFEVPNGRYRVVVSSIAWYKEEGADDLTPDQTAPNFVIQFQPVDDLESIVPPDAQHDLRGRLGWTPDPLRRPPYTPPARPEASFYPFLRMPGVLVTPFAEQEFPISAERRAEFDVLNDRGELGTGIVVVPSERLPCLASLVTIGASCDDGSGSLLLFGTGQCLVQARAIHGLDGESRISVRPYTTDRSPADSKQLRGLLETYADYVNAGKARARRHPDFEDAEFDMESLRAMTEQDEVVWDMVRRLPLPPGRKVPIARASLREQVSLLAEWLRESLS